MLLRSKHALTPVLLTALVGLTCTPLVSADQASQHDIKKVSQPQLPYKAVADKPTDTGEIIFKLVAEAVSQNDPGWKPALWRSRQNQQLATARSALPNPVFNSGFFNVPFDSLSLTENPTTQWRFGLKQAIPRGKTRQLLKQQSLALATGDIKEAQAAFLQRVRTTQNLWLELYWLNEKKRILTQNRQLLNELVQVAENKLAEGRAKQQDVIQARLEWLRLKDQLIQVSNTMAQKEARYHAIAGDGDPQWPRLPQEAREVIVNQEDLAGHPAIQRLDALMENAEKAVALAREKNKPMWVVGGEYRKRFGHDATGTERNDLFAMTASIDLPFMRRSSIDAQVQAALNALTALEEQRRAQWRALQAESGQARSLWWHARESSALYQHQLLPEARNNLQAAQDAYSAGTGDFTAVILAQKNLLDTQLQAIAQQVRQWQGWVSLQYLKGNWLTEQHNPDPLSTAFSVTPHKNTAHAAANSSSEWSKTQ